MDAELRPLNVGPGEGTRIEGPVGGPLIFKARGEQTGGALLVFENEVAPGDGPPLHTHAHEDEAWYIVEGDLRFRFEDDVQTAAEGSFVFVPRGVAHCFQNIGDRPVRTLQLFTPAGMERFFDGIATTLAGSPSTGEFRRAGIEAGMDVIGPPLSESHPSVP